MQFGVRRHAEIRVFIRMVAEPGAPEALLIRPDLVRMDLIARILRIVATNRVKRPDPICLGQRLVGSADVSHSGMGGGYQPKVVLSDDGIHIGMNSQRLLQGCDRFLIASQHQ
jgi:hypothetical protein